MLHLYIFQVEKTGEIKVGRSSNPERRRKQLQTGCPHPIIIVLVVPDHGSLEKPLHRKLQPFRIQKKGEWFQAEALDVLLDFLHERIDLDAIDLPWWSEYLAKMEPNYFD